MTTLTETYRKLRADLQAKRAEPIGFLRQVRDLMLREEGGDGTSESLKIWFTKPGAQALLDAPEYAVKWDGPEEGEVQIVVALPPNDQGLPSYLHVTLSLTTKAFEYNMTKTWGISVDGERSHTQVLTNNVLPVANRVRRALADKLVEASNKQWEPVDFHVSNRADPRLA